jgi:hypothetical protein
MMKMIWTLTAQGQLTARWIKDGGDDDLPASGTWRIGKSRRPISGRLPCFRLVLPSSRAGRTSHVPRGARM